MDFDAEMREWEREQKSKREAVQANLKKLKQFEQRVGLQNSPSIPTSQQTMEKQSTSPSRVQVHRQRSPFAADDASSPSRANRDRASVAMASRNFTRVVLSPERQRADCEAFNHHADMVAMERSVSPTPWRMLPGGMPMHPSEQMPRCPSPAQRISRGIAAHRSPSPPLVPMHRTMSPAMPMHPSEQMPRSPSPAERISRGIASAQIRPASPPRLVMGAAEHISRFGF